MRLHHRDRNVTCEVGLRGAVCVVPRNGKDSGSLFYTTLKRAERKKRRNEEAECEPDPLDRAVGMTQLFFGQRS